MKTNGSSDDLQTEMGSIRRNLGEHTEQIIEDAREQLNWQHYVAKYPWAVLGAAAAAGYFLVPSRCHCQPAAHTAPPPNAPSPAHPVNSQPASNSAPVSSAVAGVLGSVLAMVATTVAREGFATVSKLATEWWQTAQQQSAADSDNSPRERREPQL